MRTPLLYTYSQFLDSTLSYEYQRLLLSYMYLVTCTYEDIEDIYFFEVNTKYISSNVLKISEISRVRSTSEIADIFNT